ncbi:uncharacterized protein DUF1127 [Pseudomonas duriflava]|uniref:Uncharacterized protein DUF1127 n=1 Tax=Pseudomonas duriflava TaxID=459528 RepID=A0A562QKC1_9PSED|nr:DUF1127 domain-containing protein [Pseudomonas duriflava]TWI56640.1 uncharacterized protein DUF1127 [Pseudomonas duriflava]
MQRTSLLPHSAFQYFILSPTRRLWHLLGRAGHQLILWRRNAVTRRQLAWLNERELADIGITRSEQQNELNKPFWR